MARNINRLNARAVATIMKHGRHADGGGLYLSISPNGGEPVKITTIDMATGAMAMSPDGKQVAFTGSVEQPVNSYTQPDLWVMDLAKPLHQPQP